MHIISRNRERYFRIDFHLSTFPKQGRDLHVCADCDPGVGVGCAAGLVCGDNNCGKFHELSLETGLNPASDCCESKLEPTRAFPVVSGRLKILLFFYCLYCVITFIVS